MKPDNPMKTFFARFRRKPSAEWQPEPTVPENEIVEIPEPTWKDRALADFRKWLDGLPEGRPRPDGGITRSGVDDDMPILGCDLYTLLSEFVALRQEIKLQNREQHTAIRTHENLVESMKASITLFQKASRDLDSLEERIRMTAEIKSVEHFLDVRDALSRGLGAGKAALEQVYFFRKSTRERLQGVVEGYEMALRRFDRILTRFHITPLSTIGMPFDPAFMRAVGRRSDPMEKEGIVLEEQLGGFMHGDTVLRLAEVVVNG
ncbi:MAG: nucleotide exchange factor GrpE [Desulfosalsimonadaceae bacterium]